MTGFSSTEAEPQPQPQQHITGVRKTSSESVASGTLADKEQEEDSRDTEAVLDHNKNSNNSSSTNNELEKSTDERYRCVLTSSVRYQQLKQKHQAMQQPSFAAESPLLFNKAFNTSPHRDGASVTVTSPAGRAAAAAMKEDGSTPGFITTAASSYGDSGYPKRSFSTGDWRRTGDSERSAEDELDASSTLPEPLRVVASAALHELQQILRELLTAVCFLTLPLRAPSTCTVTAETALPLPRSCAAQSDNTYEEGGYDKEYMQARRALNDLTGRLESCLRQLGAQDRTISTLMRRLQVELLFPALCGPPL